jgi:hypothetical protein
MLVAAMRFLFWNVHGINKEDKLYIIQSALSEVKPVVFGLIETFHSDFSGTCIFKWLSENTNIDYIQVSGTNGDGKPNGRLNGGLCLCWNKKHFNSSSRDNKNQWNVKET